MAEQTYRIVIEGTGPAPKIEVSSTSHPPVVVPPPSGNPTPPAPPAPPVEPMNEDHSPFVFPSDGPQYQTRDYDRNYALATELPGSDYYAAELNAGNPSIASHAYAGIIAAGGQTAYGRSVGGLRLWVRVVAGEVLGKQVGPAPSNLIRRALKLGHL